MARPVRQTATAAGALSPVILNNLNGSPFNVGLGVALSAGAVLTYTVEHTFDDVFAAGFNPATATWYPNTTLTAQTVSKDSNYAYPVTAVRLNVTAWTSGTAAFTVIQAQ
jgi:hypothetical protein